MTPSYHGPKEKIDVESLAKRVSELLTATDDAELGDRPGNRRLLFELHRTLRRIEKREPSKRRAIWEIRETVKRLEKDILGPNRT